MRKKPSSKWLASPQYEGINVLDPDGWDRTDFDNSWNEPISQDEFERRLAKSTISRISS